MPVPGTDTPIEAILPINPGQAGSGYNSSDAWDYFHINSVDKDSDGNYLISARDACSVHKINGTDGSIIWRLAGNKSSFELGDGVDFCFQHHARWLSQEGDEEVLSLYDNSAHGTEHDDGSEVHTAPTSSGKIIRVNTGTWKADLVQAFFPPDDLRSKSQGSTQILPGGNALVNWGSSGAVTEFLPNGTPIFHAYMDSGDLGVGVQNYRAFRFPWTGYPTEEPAILSLENNEGTSIFVSWNGDTETAAWRFYEVSDKYGSKELLGETKRTGFETSLHVPSRRISRVTAEAIDRSGALLTGTAVVKTEQEILPIAIAAKPNTVAIAASRKPKSRWDQWVLLRFGGGMREGLGGDL